MRNCLDGLATNDNYGNLIPGIAESWNTLDEGKTWTYNLREGVSWVDYQGNEKAKLVAEDFLWGLEWVLNYAKNDARNSTMPRQLIKGATEYFEYTKDLGDAAKDLDLTKFKEMVCMAAPDDHTLTFECVGVYPYFQTAAVHSFLFPIAGGLLEEVGVDGYRAITHDKLWYNGPYTISHFVQGNEKVLTKNPLYWNKDTKSFNTVTIKMVESTDTAFLMFQNGELDAIGLTEANLQTIHRDENHKYHDNLVEMRPSRYSMQIHFQYDKKLADGEPDTNWNTTIANLAFRKSLYWGIDWTDYLARINAINPLKCTNLCFSAASLVSTADGRDYTELVHDRIGIKPSLDKYVRYDAEKGAQLKEQAMEELKAKGVTFPVELDYYISSGNQTSLDSAIVIKDVFANSLGEDYIKFNIKTYVSSFAQEVRIPQLHSMSIYGWGADFGDPLNFLAQIIVGDDGAAYATGTSMSNNVTDPELKAVLNEFTRLVHAASDITDDMDKRYAAFADAEAYALDNVIVLPLYNTVQWQLTRMNTYSAIHSAYGGQHARYINWETSKELYTTEQYEGFKKAYEAGKGGK